MSNFHSPPETASAFWWDFFCWFSLLVYLLKTGRCQLNHQNPESIYQINSVLTKNQFDLRQKGFWNMFIEI